MFDFFISLGSACPVAASMGKYGLRSCSSPFDWLITPDLSWVLYHIDTDFKDFLIQENLEPYAEYENGFWDKQSGIIFLHDKESIKNEYGALKKKYDRRIARFLEITKGKICYLRRIANIEDINYIERHADYIQSVICKKNSESEIVFLCDSVVPIPEKFPFKYFRMEEKWSGASHNALRSYFDKADNFLSFCGANYLGCNFIRNLAFDIENEAPRVKLIERRYKTLTALIAHDFHDDTFADTVIIYGAGTIGIELYNKIKDYTKVKCFVDINKAGTKFDNVNIISIDDVQYESGTKIIVSAAYDFENIKNELCNKYSSEDIISLDVILNLTF